MPDMHLSRTRRCRATLGDAQRVIPVLAMRPDAPGIYAAACSESRHARHITVAPDTLAPVSPPGNIG